MATYLKDLPKKKNYKEPQFESKETLHYFAKLHANQRNGGALERTIRRYK